MASDRGEQEERFGIATHLLRAGDLSEALEQFKLVYADAQANGNATLMASSLCEIAWTCFKMGECEEGLECAIGAKWLWRRLDNPVELVRALAVEAMLFLDLGFVDEAYELSGEAVDLARQLSSPSILAFALNARGLALAQCREFELSLVVLGEAVAIAEGHFNPAASAFYRLNLGFAHARTADEAEKLDRQKAAQANRALAIEHSLAAIEKATDAADLWTLRAAHCNCAELMARSGEMEQALHLLDECAALPDPSGPSLRIHYLYTLALVRLHAGDLATAEAACRQAIDLAESSGQLDHQVKAVELLGRILEAAGDVAGALAAQKRFHRLYVMQSGETARRRAHVEEIRGEADRLRARAAELADQAMSDPLTGIANRRSFDHILNRLAGAPFAVAMVDLDHFKQINDRYSHIMGDAVLQKVARIMVQQLGPHGHAARLGGEEFALIFPQLPMATAIAFCEGVRSAILNADWSDMADGLAVTVSIGVAAGNGDLPAGALMQIADKRLYEAKSKGRNRVTGEQTSADNNIFPFARAASA